MTCRELAEHLLKTPDRQVEVTIPDGAFESAIDSFAITDVFAASGVNFVMLCGDDIEIEDDKQ